jgi:CheY-like chemotaxis protein
MEPQILYVEDDRFSRKVVQVLLGDVMELTNLTIFENSEDFVNRIEALPEKPELIFLDIQMKPMDGFTILDLLRKHDSYKTATIIALTANVMAHDVERLKEVGFDGLIGKPIMSDIFPELVRRVLNGESIWYIP